MPSQATRRPRQHAVPAPESAPVASSFAHFSLALFASLLFTLPAHHQAQAQLPNPLDGLVILDVNGGPIIFPENSTIAPGGATIRLDFGAGDFTITSGPLTFDYLVVGAGGGGGTSTAFGTAGSGGGGAGGVVTGTIANASGTLQVTVGAGGAPGAIGNNMGQNGANSALGSIVALGGGGGAGGNASGLAGGSGGGGRGNGTTGGAALQPAAASGGFGFAGGTGSGAEGAGGGGGAGGSGSNASGDNGGSGGAGFLSIISGSPTSYGGGGGGGGRANGSPGFGGAGGGGSGANNSIAATPGAINSGGGGGGGNNDRQGAAGGSGIVIISYAGGPAATGGTISSSGGNTIHTFTTPTVGTRQANLTGILSGTGSLTFDDPGRLLLSGNNTYSGGTIINQGTVTPTQDTSLGTGTITINSAGTLEINNRNLSALPITLNGGTIINSNGWPQNALRFVTLTANSTFAGTQRFDLRSAGQLDLAGHTLTKSGTNMVSIVDSTITAGTIEVQSGIFGLTRSTWASGTANVSGGTLFFENNSVGNHSYGMAINLSGGTLRSGGGNTTTASGPITLAGGNTLQIDNNTFTASGTISGTGSLTKTGGGTLNLNGNNTYSGQTIIDSGTVVLGSNSALGATSAGTTINAAGTLNLNARNIQGEAITLNGGTITNTGGDQANALRTVTLTANSTFTGSNRFDVRGGGGLLDLGGHTLTKSGTNKIAVVDSTITAGTINIQTGEFGLTRSTWNSGTANLNGGTLWLENNNGANHSYGMTINLNGGTTLRSSGGVTTVNGPINLSGTSSLFIENNSFTAAGGLAGTGGFDKTGGGTLRLTAASSHSGVSNLVGGIVEIGHDQAFGTGLLDLRGSTVRSTDSTARTIANNVSLSDNTTFGSATTGDLTFSGSINKGGLAKIVNVQNTTTTFSGTISGSGTTGPLTKTGPGTLIQSGTSTFASDTIVQQGSLELNGTIQNSPVIVLPDGRFSGTGTVNSSLSIQGGTLAPGSQALFGLGTLTLNGNLDFASTWEVSIDGSNASLLLHNGSLLGSLDDVTLAAGTTHNPTPYTPYLIYSGTSSTSGTFANMLPASAYSALPAPLIPDGWISLDGTPYGVFYNVDFATQSPSGFDIVLVSIPEPSRPLLLAAALTPLLIRRRRR